jgi:hypothetical protein
MSPDPREEGEEVRAPSAPNRELGCQAQQLQRGHGKARPNELLLIGAKRPQLGPAAAVTR